MTWDGKTVPALAVALLNVVEGCRLKAYRDGGGRWTIGVGSLTMPSGHAVKAGDALTQTQADALLVMQCEKWVDVVTDAITSPLTEAMASALISFTHNLGPHALAGSMVQKMANAGRCDLAFQQFAGWVLLDGTPSIGLMHRRQSETLLALGRALLPAAANAQAQQMSAAEGMVLYRSAFAAARAWGWKAVTPAERAASVVSKPIADANDDAKTDALNTAQLDESGAA